MKGAGNFTLLGSKLYRENKRRRKIGAKRGYSTNQ